MSSAVSEPKCPTVYDQWATWREKWEANQKKQKELKAKTVEQGWSLLEADDLVRKEYWLLRELVQALAFHPTNTRHWNSYNRQQVASLIEMARVVFPEVEPRKL